MLKIQYVGLYSRGGDIQRKVHRDQKWENIHSLTQMN